MAVPRRSGSHRSPSDVQAAWLRRGLAQPGGKLPLFDERGQRVKKPTVDACLKAGWAERWFDNPLKPDWLVCRLTDAGRTALAGETEAKADAAVERDEEARQGALI
ncbi:hypothetical protein [Azospirillum agricola]|uniref:hypothetical protein n=1 Tax=Azospirillum agricola TaxID=1720247 RepID=UPI000A0F0C36|nr:hypothetical protein [Azospirillum agricola]MBP2231399.1 hypothetical protein [Azospirillum agricola]SMH57887.1 hypothetical protein SAMN02982994_4438 [Azospirillum lipoferum]